MSRLLINAFLFTALLVGCSKGDGEIGADALPGAVPNYWHLRCKRDRPSE